MTKAANVTKIRMSLSAGATSNSVSYIFLTTDEQEINVTIESLDADGNTLFSKNGPQRTLQA